MATPDSPKSLFSYKDTILTPSDPNKPYRRRSGEDKKAIPWGQRKLGMSLIQFITYYWDHTKVPFPKVIYAGAAPGSNIKFVSTLFPQIEWHLYDPRPFNISPSDKIHLYCQYFTDDTAMGWKGQHDIYFISDIRSVDYKISTPEQVEKEVWKDMQDQQRWHSLMNPLYSQFKFRLPYYALPNNIFGEEVKYVSGTVFFGIWSPQTSTETRLVVSNNSEISTWNIKLYENQLFFHNSEIRENHLFNNTCMDSEFGQEYDSSAEIYVWKKYLEKMGGISKSTPQNIINLGKAFTKFLNSGRSEDSWVTLAKLRSDTGFLKRLIGVLEEDDD